MSWRLNQHRDVTGRADGVAFHIRYPRGDTADVWVPDVLTLLAKVTTLTCPSGFYVSRADAARLIREARSLPEGSVGAVRYRYVRSTEAD